MVTITADILRRIAKAAHPQAAPRAAVINGIVEHWHIAEARGIDTREDAAGFLGQACIETDYFKTTKEYWGPTAQQKKYDPASGSQLSKDLGNTEVGDGKLYMGRGIFQNTGKYNYTLLSQEFGEDFVGTPELLETPEWSMQCAVSYWNQKNLGQYAAAQNWTAISRGVNRGNPKSKSKANHEAERIKASRMAYTLLGNPAPAKPAPKPTPKPASKKPEQFTDEDTVMRVQAKLDELGWYEVGEVDGRMGKRTQGAILSYRNDRGLPNVNYIDQELLDSLDAAAPRAISAKRATATVGELRKANDETIRTTDTQVKIAGAGGAFAALGAFDQRGAIDKAKEVMDQFGSVREIGDGFLDVIQWFAQTWYLPVLLICAFFAYKAWKVQQKRVDDHRSGKNVEM